MIYPKKNRLFKWMVHTYVHWLTIRHFKEINFNDIAVDSSKSVLLVANHFSVWDTIILFRVNRKLLKKKFHIMMLESTALKEPFLKYAGGFSINKKTRDMVNSLDFAAELLREPKNLVLIFPQGKLYSNLITEVEFEKGIIQVIKKAAGNFQLIFAATFMENFDNLKPVANVHLVSVTDNNFNTISDLQQAYQQHYTKSRQQQIQIVK
ncbi:glycerol acyltransferase [Mucilaginibacter corticis]|uniref:Glycerol acyltransferase n=1 Tax=Mucilaginibacter corticis TaxID=2597670 RepID=A0A556MVH4_9SPHI|nr:1-acyl-sn-glycerol-3-phosphate acyltransferase [Mucilaginibacter corticis]TSJ43941.1 glycerol acyltransferase [Mucilaginibacter corticis]